MKLLEAPLHTRNAWGVCFIIIIYLLSAFPRCRRDLTHVCFAYAVPTKGTAEFPVRYRPIYVLTEKYNDKRVTNVMGHVCFAQSTVIMCSISNVNERRCSVSA